MATKTTKKTKVTIDSSSLEKEISKEVALLAVKQTAWDVLHLWTFKTPIFMTS